MNYRYIALLSFFLSFTSCKKQEAAKELYNVEVNDTAIIFSSLNSDTVGLDFASIRIKQAHTLVSGALNDGFALSKAAVILPNIPLAIQKQQFTYGTLDTLRNDDLLKTINYNIREYPDSPARGIVKTFNRDF